MIMVFKIHGFHRSVALITGLCAWTSICRGHTENAVLNPGFETYYQAPWMVSQLNSKQGYCDPLDASSDFKYDGLASTSPRTESPWSGCSTDLYTEDGSGFASTRTPLVPHAPEVKPRSGKAMAGFHPIEMMADGSTKWFERIGGTFSAPLQSGILYQIRFQSFDFFEGSDASIQNLKLQMAFQNGRYKDSTRTVNDPKDVPGAVELTPGTKKNGWRSYEGSFRPAPSNLTHFVFGFLKGKPVAGRDFTPYRAGNHSHSSYLFIDEVEVSCTYELAARFEGVGADQDPSTPEFDVILPTVSRNGEYEIDGSLSRNTGAHTWIVEEIDASGKTIGTPLQIHSMQRPGILRVRFKELSRYRITLRGGCHLQTSDSAPIHVRTGKYRIEDTIGPPDIGIKDSLSCDPGLHLELAESTLDCGQPLSFEAGALGAESHQWILTHVDSGRTLTRSGSGNPVSSTLSRLFPGITETGTYTLTLQGRCASGLPWSRISRSFAIRELPLDWVANPGLELQVNQTARFAPKDVLPPGTTFEWNFDEGFQSRTASTREAEFAWSVRGEFDTSLGVTRPNGCKSTTQRKVRVLDSQIHVPDAFTPNGDFLNDTFRPVSQDVVFTLIVYDRFGGKIFEDRFDPLTPGDFTGWDGRVSGAEPVEGVYAYMIVSHSGPQFSRRGTVTLLR
jgi:gliding motility-associated-like protein